MILSSCKLQLENEKQFFWKTEKNKIRVRKTRTQSFRHHVKKICEMETCSGIFKFKFIVFLFLEFVLSWISQKLTIAGIPPHLAPLAKFAPTYWQFRIACTIGNFEGTEYHKLEIGSGGGKTVWFSKFAIVLHGLDYKHVDEFRWGV